MNHIRSGHLAFFCIRTFTKKVVKINERRLSFLLIEKEGKSKFRGKKLLVRMKEKSPSLVAL